MNNYAPTTFARELAARIRGYVARYDVSQADLAVLCDVSQSQFSKILRGVRPMSVDQLAVVCESLGLSTAKLVEEVWTFIQERDLGSSPIIYVEHDERLEQPLVWREDVLDAWGRQALERIDAGGVAQNDLHAADLQKDFDLAASDDASAVDPAREP